MSLSLVRVGREWRVLHESGRVVAYGTVRSVVEAYMRHADEGAKALPNPRPHKAGSVGT